MSSHALSSTLKNLKFMQRSKPKEVKKDVEEENTVAVNSFDDVPFVSSHPFIKRKCVVIMEGNPLPGAVRGRMSFQGFNPTIDKLNQEAVGCSTQSSMPNTEKLNCEISGRSQDDQEAARRNGSMEIDMSSPCVSEQKIGTLSEENGKRASNNQRKQRRREKLDWSVLKRPKIQDKDDAT